MVRYFTPATFEFLTELASHNEREWFNANKSRYQSDVQEPALQLVADFAPHLEKISLHYQADPRPSGGSLFRIYRDIRFSKDKTPYKTHVALRFGHEAGGDVRAPGFYLHIEPAASYAGAGLWRPETAQARQIRQAIVDDPAGWKKAAHGKAFLNRYDPDGYSLSRPPQGFDPNHPLIDDLKRKDFIAGTRLEDSMVLAPDFLRQYAALSRSASPFMAFLTKAVGLPY